MKSKIIFVSISVLLTLSLIAGFVFGKSEVGAPKTVIHHVALKWKEGTTDADKQKAMTSLREVLSEIPGAKNMWSKTIKVQPKEYSQTFVIEFEDEAALKAYAENPKKKEWDDFYYNIRETSYNCVTTN